MEPYLDSLPAVLHDCKVISPIIDQDGCQFAMLIKDDRKSLIVGTDKINSLCDRFNGVNFENGATGFLICELSAQNAQALRSVLPFTNPVPIGNKDSFGFGDRLGNAGVTHLRSLENSNFLPILAQQSIRELDRTGRTAQEVMDAATWAILQVGYKDGFGADADHLKTFKDIDRMADAGFTMYTIDPSDHVDNRVVELENEVLKKVFEELPWDRLNDKPGKFLDRYVDKTFELAPGISLKPSGSSILKAAVKYGRVMLHTLEMFQYLKNAHKDIATEVELSVDETPHPTTPEEHLVIASELKRLNVELVSLAPRFSGEFEKGVDFKGDMAQFKSEYIIHQAIAANYGGYKLSIHSGSDKFGVYEAIGSLDVGTVHIKTAGTSYLEALRAIAMTAPVLFQEIFAFSLKRFETDKKTYHISADSSLLKEPVSYSDQSLADLLNDDHARQVFHVTFGSVLTEKDTTGRFLFKERIMQTLATHNEIYEECLYSHFRRHIKPFEV